MKNLKLRLFSFYIPLFIIMILSILNLYKIHYLNPTNNLYIKQNIWYLIFISIILIFQKINLNKLFKWSHYIYIINVILLILVLFVGKETNGARAWFKIGKLAFQPSELMKFSLSLIVANISSKTKLTSCKKEFLLILKILFITLIPSVLVFLEPDTGAIIFYLIISFSILYSVNIHKKWFFLLSVLIILFLILFGYLFHYNQDLLLNLLGTSIFYRIDRLINFKSNIGYQLNNALTVIGSAKLFTFNFDNSLYIPESATDFIFAFSTGNFGIIISIIIIILYISIIIFLINQYFINKNKKIKLFLISFINMFIFNVIINILMNIGLFPIIGIPLPFFSYGGSTIVIYALYLGMIVKIIKNGINT